MAQGGVLKLQLGCGANILTGWLNTDSMPSPSADYLDFTKRFPFGDNVFGAIFCEHTIEHVPKSQAQATVREVHRVLRPGGAFRVVTPSLEMLGQLIVSQESPMSHISPGSENTPTTPMPPFAMPSILPFMGTVTATSIRETI